MQHTHLPPLPPAFESTQIAHVQFSEAPTRNDFLERYGRATPARITEDAPLPTTEEAIDAIKRTRPNEATTRDLARLGLDFINEYEVSPAELLADAEAVYAKESPIVRMLLPRHLYLRAYLQEQAMTTVMTILEQRHGQDIDAALSTLDKAITRRTWDSPLTTVAGATRDATQFVYLYNAAGNELTAALRAKDPARTEEAVAAVMGLVPTYTSDYGPLVRLGSNAGATISALLSLSAQVTQQ